MLLRPGAKVLWPTETCPLSAVLHQQGFPMGPFSGGLLFF